MLRQIDQMKLMLAGLGLALLLRLPLFGQDDDSPGDVSTGSAPHGLDALIAQATDEIQTSPDDATNYIKRGRLYFAKGDYPDAAGDFSQALQLDPNNRVALFQLGRSHFRGGETDAAIADYTHFLELRADAPAALVNRGAAYLRERKLDQAIADESQALQGNPTSVVALGDRARAYELKGDYDASIADETQLLKIEPTAAQSYVRRGVDHGLKGEYALARADFNSALEANPNLASAYNNLAWQMATCPDPDFRDGRAAIENAMKACELWRWMAPGPVDTLAAAYAEAGDFDSAVKWEEKFLQYPLSEAIRPKGQSRLALYQAGQPYHREDEAKDGTDSPDDSP